MEIKPDEVPVVKVEKKEVAIKEAPAVVQNYQREEVSRGQVRNFFKPFLFQEQSKPHFIRATFFLIMAKGVGLTTPFILKRIVDTLTATTYMGGVGGPVLPLAKVIQMIGLWGFTRVFSSICLCQQMNAVTAGIQTGIKRVASRAFSH